MPEIQGNQLDVSREEEIFLRRTFRRFALPWVMSGLALGALAGSLPDQFRPDDVGPASSVEDPRLREEIAALRSDLAALSQRTVAAESAVSKTKERLVALEGRAGASGASTPDVEESARRIDAALRRLQALEQQVSGAAGAPGFDPAQLEERVASLGGRLARLEGELRSERPLAPPADAAR
jgi:hypothetical protein